jgi:hypothetical protein
MCEQVTVTGAVATDKFNEAVRVLKENCERAQGTMNANGCPTANAAGGCRKTEGQAQSSVIIYKGGFDFPIDQLKAKCQENGMEFFQP